MHYPASSVGFLLKTMLGAVLLRVSIRKEVPGLNR